jgi:flagellar protein FliO/FliZ
MLLPITLLPLAAVLINDVKTEYVGNVLTVDVATSEPIAREDIRAMSGGSHRYYVYVDGSSTPQANFEHGGERVVVHPRSRYTKLEIPTATRCADPFSVEPIRGGIRLRAECREGAGVQTAAIPPVRVAATGSTDEHPLPDGPLAAAVVPQRAKDSSLRAALSLPADPVAGAGAAGPTPRPGQVAGGAAREATAANPANSTDGARAEGAASAGTTAGKSTVLATTASAEPANTPNGNARKGADSNMVSTGLAALVLIGIGALAFVLARRRTGRGRMIRILETASIGPRRSLVVASIQGRTMVLGVSEAGVSLLDSPATSGVGLGDEQDKASTGAFEDAALGLRGLVFGKPRATESDAESPKHESSLLSRLFNRAKPAAQAVDASDDEDGARAFDRLLSESLEDEELRRKLALGQSGRVA